MWFCVVAMVLAGCLLFKSFFLLLLVRYVMCGTGFPFLLPPSLPHPRPQKRHGTLTETCCTSRHTHTSCKSTTLPANIHISAHMPCPAVSPSLFCPSFSAFWFYFARISFFLFVAARSLVLSPLTRLPLHLHHMLPSRRMSL